MDHLMRNRLHEPRSSSLFSSIQLKLQIKGEGSVVNGGRFGHSHRFSGRGPIPAGILIADKISIRAVPLRDVGEY